MSLRIFEVIRIRNEEINRIMRIILKYKEKAIKEIKHSELKCYDYADVEDLLNNIIEEIQK